MSITKDNSERTHAIILVVDDERDIQNFFRFKLQKIGYDVVIANNGFEAIEKVKKFRPDLITMDIMMPVMDGLKATEHLKNHKDYKDIPIIIVSAVGDVKGKAAAYSFGANDYLTKPVDIITMAARIRSILETQKLRKQIERLSDSKAITDNLFDYQHLFERIDTDLEKCRKKQHPFSLLYLDIDYMKMTNAENGFKAGDFVIRSVREIIYREIGENGTVLLSNSDKFLVILPNVTENKIQIFAKQIIKHVEEVVLPFDVTIRDDVKVIGISVSMGMVTWDKVEKVMPDKLISLAETALKNAKDEGRGTNVQYQFFSRPGPSGKHIIDKKVIK
ncbi:response regulator [candidate division KSB1 bacterium]